MFNNILIIGCGLIGSSILKASIQKKISKNFFVFEKSKKYRSIIKTVSYTHLRAHETGSYLVCRLLL